MTRGKALQDNFQGAIKSKSTRSQTIHHKEQGNLKNTKHQFALLRGNAVASLIAPLAVLCLCFIPFSSAAAQNPNVGPGKVVVHTEFGGFILGYDIDRAGTEGLLAESHNGAGGKFDVAVETFDQATGKIVKVVTQQTNTNNDFVTFGVFGNSVGLVEEEISDGQFVNKRVYGTMNPLSGNKFTGKWTPPFTKDDIVSIMPFSQGSPTEAVLYFDDFVSFTPSVIETNVAANTFGTPISIPDTTNFNVAPAMAYDSQTNQAVLGGSEGCFGCTTEIGIVDLTTGAFTEFEGLGFGFVNGIAVDPATGIAVTATEDDASLEFYDVAKQTGTLVVLQGAQGCLGCSQAMSGEDIEFDPIHKLFLVAQPVSSTSPTGSSIQVYDEQGNFVESVNGLNMPISGSMVLQPSKRAGYALVTPSLTELQSFTY